MILYASLYRTHDGLPLCATTDVKADKEMRDCLRFAKQISKRLPYLQDRCILRLIGYNMFLISSPNIALVAVTNDSYPTVLAFSFLSEVQTDFLKTYDTFSVESALRPYGCIGFENTLQKIRGRFNSPRSLNTRLNLQDLQLELRMRPPHILKEEDLESDIFSQPSETSLAPIIVPGGKTVSMGWQGYIAILCSVVCSFINIVRGMAVIGHGHFDDYDGSGTYIYGVLFLVAAITHVVQIYLLNFHVHRRQLSNVLCLLSLCVTIVALQKFRIFQQSLFYVATALGTTYTIHKQSKSNALHEHVI